MTGELTAFGLACGLGFATVCCPSGDQRICQGRDFRLRAESPVVMLPGETRTIDIVVDRAGGFDRTLRLQAAAPRGVHVKHDISQLTSDAGGLVRVTITVDSDCCIGQRIITMAAFSDYRQVTTIPIRLLIEGSQHVTRQ